MTNRAGRNSRLAVAVSEMGKRTRKRPKVDASTPVTADLRRRDEQLEDEQQQQLLLQLSPAQRDAAEAPMSVTGPGLCVTACHLSFSPGPPVAVQALPDLQHEPQ